MIIMAAAPGFLQHLANLEEAADDQEAVHNYRIQRKRLRNMCNPFNAPEKIFKTNFRLNKNITHSLIQRLAPHLMGERAFSLTPAQKVLTALKFLACGSYQRGSIAQHNLLNVSQSAVSKCLTAFLDAMEAEVVKSVIKFPQTAAEKQRVKDGFYQKFGLPGVVGAVDCTRIKMKRPKENEEQYFCHHQCHCINVQIICDSDLQISNVNPRHAGATNDAYIWRFSVINNRLRNAYNNGESNTWVIGDSGYPILPWVLTPIVGAGHTDTPEGRYTDCHILARNVIERLNGVLKQMWRCLLKERALHYSPAKVRKIIRAFAALHNIAMNMEDYMDFALNFDVGGYVEQEEPIADEDEDAEFDAGLEVRQNLINNRFT